VRTHRRITATAFDITGQSLWRRNTRGACLTADLSGLNKLLTPSSARRAVLRARVTPDSHLLHISFTLLYASPKKCARGATPLM
jgi:hypothetical protein